MAENLAVEKLRQSIEYLRQAHELLFEKAEDYFSTIEKTEIPDRQFKEDKSTQTLSIGTASDCEILSLLGAYHSQDSHTQTNFGSQETKTNPTPEKEPEPRRKILQEQLAKLTRDLKSSKTQLATERHQVSKLQNEQKVMIEMAVAECRRESEAEIKSLREQLKKERTTSKNSSEQIEKLRAAKIKVEKALQENRTELDTSRTSVASSHLQIEYLSTRVKTLRQTSAIEVRQAVEEGEKMLALQNIRHASIKEELEDELNVIKAKGIRYFSRKERNQLKQRITKLEQDRDMLKPLVEVGAAVRLRYLEQAREWLGHVSKYDINQRLIRQGNIAAHHANMAADAALVVSDFFAHGTITSDFYEIYLNDPVAASTYDQILLRVRNCETTTRTLRTRTSTAASQQLRVELGDLAENLCAVISAIDGKFIDEEPEYYEWPEEMEQKVEELVRLERGQQES